MSLLRNSHVDQLNMDLWIPENPVARSDDGLNGILEVLETHAGVLMPDKVATRGKRTAKYSRSAAQRQLGRTSYPIRSVWLERPATPEAQYRIAFFEVGPNECEIEAHIAPLGFFQGPEHAVERSQDVVSLARAFACRYCLY